MTVSARFILLSQKAPHYGLTQWSIPLLWCCCTVCYQGLSQCHSFLRLYLSQYRGRNRHTLVCFATNLIWSAKVIFWKCRQSQLQPSLMSKHSSQLQRQLQKMLISMQIMSTPRSRLQPRQSVKMPFQSQRTSHRTTSNQALRYVFGYTAWLAFTYDRILPISPDPVDYVDCTVLVRLIEEL